MKSHRTPTMKDVARESGVSLGTVSKVFNGQYVGDDYRQRVNETAARLGYQVNKYARGLRTNKTFQVAVIMPNIVNPFFSALTQSIYQSLSKRGYRMLLSLTDFNEKAEENCIHIAMENQVDGIIGLTYNPRLTLPEKIPFVSFDRPIHPGVPCVTSDNLQGGMLAAEKLCHLGCKHLLFIRIGSRVVGESDKRRNGFISYCAQNNIPYESLYLYDDQGINRIWQYLDNKIRNGALPFDGIFCCTDSLALAVKEYLAQKGISVPKDVQLIGFDGTFVHLGSPPVCSTILQPIPAIADTCVDLLLQKNDISIPDIIRLPVRYIEGGTTEDSQKTDC